MEGRIERVLLISNDPGLDTLLTDLLSSQTERTFEIQQVGTPQAGLKGIPTGNYDLVILDLPAGEDCATAAEMVCRACPYLPIVVLSQDGNRFALHAIKIGVQQIVSKSHLDAQLTCQTILAAINRKAIENEIRMRDEILQAVNQAAEIFLVQKNWEEYLPQVLEALGKATCSDRVYVFRHSENEDGDVFASLHAQWSMTDFQLERTLLLQKGLGYLREGYQRWLELFRRGEIIHGNVEQLPKQEQPLLMKLGIQSFVYVPILIDHSLWGFMGFDQCQSRIAWSQAAVDALTTAARILGAAIASQSAQEKLTFLATHDHLTHLPNRLLFEDRFAHTIARSERSKKKFAIVSIDLDKFKGVNDTFGHQTGDKVLCLVARSLENSVRSSDTCARIGGDEFVVIAEDIHNKADVIRVMEKIVAALQKRLNVDQNCIEISASMGASIYPLHGRDIEKLMRAADKALYLTKESGIRYKIFTDEQISWLND